MDLNSFFSESNMPFTICCTVLFLLALFSWILRTRSVATKKAPPEAGGGWPLIGHLHLLGGSQPPHITLGKMADKYGPVFTLRLGVHKTLVVSNLEMAKECFAVNDKAFASRPKTIATEVLGWNFSMFGFSPYGSYWRQMRKIAMQEVFSTHRIEMLKHVMESEVKAAVKERYEFWAKMNQEGGRAVTDLKKWFGDIALNVLFRTVIGKRLVGVDCDGDEEENERIRNLVNDFFHLSGLFVMSDALPFLRWLDLDGKEREMKKVAKELEEFAQVWLDQHKHNKKRCLEKGETEVKRDFMDVLIDVIGDEDFEGRDANTIVKATCVALILAGTDTTFGTMTWALSLLLNNRETMNKAVYELDTQIGREKTAIDEPDLKKMEYLQAIIKETLRLYPAGPLSVPHESMEDCIVGGYHVPSGIRLLTNISKIQQDPLLYSNPLEFCPERFLTAHKDVDLKGQHFELIPFGSGRRMCPGISFSLQLMQITLATLLHGFDIVTLDGGPVDMKEESGLTNVRASPLHVILTPRLSTEVYG